MSVREALEQVVVEEAHTLVALAHGPYLSLQAPRSDDQVADVVVQERMCFGSFACILPPRLASTCSRASRSCAAPREADGRIGGRTADTSTASEVASCVGQPSALCCVHRPRRFGNQEEREGPGTAQAACVHPRRLSAASSGALASLERVSGAEPRVRRPQQCPRPPRTNVTRWIRGEERGGSSWRPMFVFLRSRRAW